MKDMSHESKEIVGKKPSSFQFFQYMAKILLLLFPFVIIILWSAFPATQAALATITFTYNEENLRDLAEPHIRLDYRRSVQKHFLNYGVYIPIDDIAINNKYNRYDKLYLTLLIKSCGRGKLYIWVPFRFRIPIIGEKVVEWCWRQK